MGKWIYEVIPIPSESILPGGGAFDNFSTIGITFQDLSVESFYKSQRSVSNWTFIQFLIFLLGWAGGEIQSQGLDEMGCFKLRNWINFTRNTFLQSIR